MVRLYLEHALEEGETVALSREQAHYLTTVMRLGAGAVLEVFDGQTGAFRAVLSTADKRAAEVRVEAQTRPFLPPPDLWLLFAPIKKARTDFIVEKAAELGAARICPVSTAHTQSDRINRDRLQAHAVEAAEQCGGTFVPAVDPLQPLSAVLDDWPCDRRLMVCNERLADGPATATLDGKGAPWAILIGPEGGFSDDEVTRLTALPTARAVRLGPRILRADTAAVAALTLWQSTLGDWQ